MIMKKVLIVDDEPMICSMLTAMIACDGTSVTSCSSFEEAVRLLSGHFLPAPASFDLIITDVMLGGKSEAGGLDLLSFIKKQCPDVPVIVITGCGIDSVENEAYRRGAFRFFDKPLFVTRFLQSVETLDIPVAFRRRSVQPERIASI